MDTKLGKRQAVLDLLQLPFTSDRSDPTAVEQIEHLKHESKRPTIVLPGGGIFFYHLLGQLSYLHSSESVYQAENISYRGSSAGAIAGTLAALGVNFESAVSRALDYAHEFNIWGRRLKLIGTWGAYLRTWLEDVLPNETSNISNGNFTVTLTPIKSKSVFFKSIEHKR